MPVWSPHMGEPLVQHGMHCTVSVQPLIYIPIDVPGHKERAPSIMATCEDHLWLSEAARAGSLCANCPGRICIHGDTPHPGRLPPCAPRQRAPASRPGMALAPQQSRRCLMRSTFCAYNNYIFQASAAGSDADSSMHSMPSEFGTPDSGVPLACAA